VGLIIETLKLEITEFYMRKFNLKNKTRRAAVFLIGYSRLCRMPHGRHIKDDHEKKQDLKASISTAAVLEYTSHQSRLTVNPSYASVLMGSIN
jgi:hypothetical protein